MQAEKRRYGKALPKRSCHPHQNDEQESCVDCVKDNARQMVTIGMQAEEFDVDDMREPGQGVPISCFVTGSSPRKAGPGYSLLYMKIGSDVQWVIETNKVIF